MSSDRSRSPSPQPQRRRRRRRPRPKSTSPPPPWQCKVKGCRFPFHVTWGHKCGGCSAFGHGRGECKSDPLKRALLQYEDDRVADGEECTASFCAFPTFHSLQGHCCGICKRFGHGGMECPARDRLRRQDRAVAVAAGGRPAGNGAVLAPNVHVKRLAACPFCNAAGVATSPDQVFGSCEICMDFKGKLVLLKCGHTLCATCVAKMPEA